MLLEQPAQQSRIGTQITAPSQLYAYTLLISYMCSVTAATQTFMLFLMGTAFLIVKEMTQAKGDAYSGSIKWRYGETDCLAIDYKKSLIYK